MGLLGVGTDLVQIKRIADLRKRFGDRFCRRVFHPDEIALCQNSANPDIHFASRFAAKEALGKALGTGVFALGFNRINTIRNSDGRPILLVSGTAASICKEHGVTNMHISLSHEGEYALAVVILEGEIHP
jgi:holo-[acyl-carrier protein] synthase